MSSSISFKTQPLVFISYVVLLNLKTSKERKQYGNQ